MNKIKIAVTKKTINQKMTYKKMKIYKNTNKRHKNKFNIIFKKNNV